MLCLLGIWWSFGAKKELELGGRGGMEVSGKYFVNSCFADLGFWFCLLFSVCRFQNSAQQLWACKGCLRLWSHGWKSLDSSKWSGWAMTRVCLQRVDLCSLSLVCVNWCNSCCSWHVCYWFSGRHCSWYLLGLNPNLSISFIPIYLHLNVVRQHKCSQICSVAVRDLQGFAPTGNFTECLGTWIRGTWVLCSTAEQGQEASQRTVMLLGALIDQQHREKDGGAVLSSFGSKYESFCYQTDSKSKFSGRVEDSWA